MKFHWKQSFLHWKSTSHVGYHHHHKQYHPPPGISKNETNFQSFSKSKPYIYGGKHAASLFCQKHRIKLCVADSPFLGKRDKTSHVSFAMITSGYFSLEALLTSSIKAITVSHIVYVPLVGTKYGQRFF